jgi:hypothetical protein
MPAYFKIWTVLTHAFITTGELISLWGKSICEPACTAITLYFSLKIFTPSIFCPFLTIRFPFVHSESSYSFQLDSIVFSAVRNPKLIYRSEQLFIRDYRPFFLIWFGLLVLYLASCIWKESRKSCMLSTFWRNMWTIWNKKMKYRTKSTVWSLIHKKMHGYWFTTDFLETFRSDS